MMSALLWFIVLPVLASAAVLSVWRLIVGPSFPDRVVALDLLTTIGVGVLAVFALATENYALVDVAIVVTLISFLGTVAFARYTEWVVRQ